MAQSSGSMKKPKAGDLWDNYPNYTDKTAAQVWAMVGGTMGSEYGSTSPITDTCATRLSWAINHCPGLEIIPSTEFQTNKNSDGQRYILSAAKMDGYLKKHWGNPNYTMPPLATVADVRSHLGTGDIAVIVWPGGTAQGHVAIVTPTYKDQYTPRPSGAGTGDVWIIHP
jgi:hypothetical protein